MATAYQVDGILYSLESHRDARGHFATWRCSSCGTAGGKSKVCPDSESALEAARLQIAGHQARNHSGTSAGTLFSLAYSSQAVAAFSMASLGDLAQHAAAKNELLDVTGYLTYDVDFETFLQFLEGPRSVVEALMGVISNDPRHRILNVVRVTEAERQFAAASAAASEIPLPRTKGTAAVSPADMRMFSTWRMKLVTRTDFQAMNLEELLINVLSSMRKADLGDEYVTGSILELSNELRFRAPLAMI